MPTGEGVEYWTWDETGEIDPRTIRYSNDVKQTAFLIWFRHGRSTRVVHEKLASDEEYRDLAGFVEGDPVPPVRTLNAWCKNGFWELNAQDKMRELAPMAIRHAAVEIAYSSQDAGRTITRIARGDDIRPGDKLALDAAKFVVQATVGDSVANLARPTVTTAIDMSKLETMEDIVAAEKALMESTESR